MHLLDKIEPTAPASSWKAPVAADSLVSELNGPLFDCKACVRPTWYSVLRVLGAECPDTKHRGPISHVGASSHL